MVLLCILATIVSAIREVREFSIIFRKFIEILSSPATQQKFYLASRPFLGPAYPCCPSKSSGSISSPTGYPAWHWPWEPEESDVMKRPARLLSESVSPTVSGSTPSAWSGLPHGRHEPSHSGWGLAFRVSALQSMVSPS